MKHYQEEPDSSFTHHGQLHNLNILFKEVEALWADCKTAASKKFKKGEEDDGYWPYVTTCTRNKLGLKKPVTESIMERWAKDGTA